MKKPARQFNNAKYTLIYLFILPVALIHCSTYIIKKYEGYPQRFEETSRVYEQLKLFASAQRPKCLQQKNIDINVDCVLGAKNQKGPTSFMIGDSFSNHYWRFMDALAQEANLSILAHATVACLTLPGISQYDWYTKNEIYKECHEQTTRYYNMIKANHYDFVIIGQNWNGYLDNKIINHLKDERSIELTKKRITKALDKALQIITASGAKPILIKSIALTQGNPHDCFFEHIKRRKKYNPEQCDFNLEPKQQQWFNDLFLRMKDKYTQLIVIDPTKAQCPAGRCNVDINGVPVFRDAEHITDYASYHLASLYLQQYKNPLVT